MDVDVNESQPEIRKLVVISVLVVTVIAIFVSSLIQHQVTEVSDANNFVNISFDPPTGFTVYVQTSTGNDDMTFSCDNPGAASPAVTVAGTTYGCYNASESEADELIVRAQAAVYVCADSDVSWSASAEADANSNSSSASASVPGDSSSDMSGGCVASSASASNSGVGSGTIFASAASAATGRAADCDDRFADVDVQVCISAPPTPTPTPTATPTPTPTPLPTHAFKYITPGPVTVQKNFTDSSVGHGSDSKVILRLFYSLSPVTMTLSQGTIYTRNTYSPLFTKAATGEYSVVISDSAQLTFVPRDQLTRTLDVPTLTAQITATSGVSPVIVCGTTVSNTNVEIRRYYWTTVTYGTTPTHQIKENYWTTVSDNTGAFSVTLPVTFSQWLTDIVQAWLRNPYGPDQPEDLDVIWQLWP